ncbi:MAG TPA: ankyrin repeat domain-containing protein [Bryobacteraceae bacterium]|nr:ankyrin repeat domain-containing protein [Bryobacteraceae bacterium]
MSKEFFDAIRAGDRGKVSVMLAADAGLLNAKDESGLGAFTAAKYAGKNDLAAMLLEQGVVLDIFAACIAGAEQRVVELAGAQRELVGNYSHDGWTPLHLACFFGHAAIAEALLTYGADVAARSHNAMQNTPLHAAAAGRSVDAVRVLIEHGADVNARQHGGWMALHAAAQNGDVEMVRLVIASGADVKARADNNQNAMDLALTKGHQAVVNLLDEYVTGGADD